MKILLLGSNGQVGWELQRALAPLGEITAPTRTEEGGLCGDLTRPDRLAATVRKVAPDVIVNAAAYTAVDQAESEPELANAINATAPEVLAAEANALGAWLVHYSTDYVFDGTGADPWCEDDATGPLNVYGQTKREGEAAIQASGCRHLIFRTSWVYASRGRNFIRTMLRLAADRAALQVIDDQFGAPTGAELIADTTAQILSQPLDRAEISGLYHLAAAGETTWHGFARLVIATARDAGWPVRVTDQAIEAVPTEAFPTAARRPGNSRLNCKKLETTFGLRMPDWRGGALRALDEILACESPGGSA
ncbi:dTDP-4-dehydrorhamnose reductase [Thioalkalivibrio sp. ALE11]|uniref:dTDP-4-dehydrorhamnose reductase n=1 Tax=Thioalkalivibrio sp. ALE11 TaxID=1265494 RepID=UPI00035E2F62|nr:dTDP-4-dehydrorhamnose reductase [Thioalkalivibrio sp. ALE11]